MIFGKEKVPYGVLAGLCNVSQSNHLQPGPIDVKGNAIGVAHADEVGAVFDDSHKTPSILFGPPTVGDVIARGREKQTPSRLVLDWQNRDIGNSFTSIADVVRQFRMKHLAGSSLGRGGFNL